ncbi:hypothetical protein ACFOWE_23015 [Planomonospora corallina]|uniref:Uncharacterized protein n=1 Tax=Planomonospora corallina TaxID=1806052 RepID=A0ABV8IDH1_9ACTN
MMAGRGNGSWQITSLHVDGQGSATCRTYPARTPIFEVAADKATVTVTIPADRLDAAAVMFARELAQAAHCFAVEIERRWRGLPSAGPRGRHPYRDAVACDKS